MTRIAHAEVLTSSPGRNFVTLRLTTEDGLTGLGDATLNGRELAVASYLEEHVVPLLIGRPSGSIEDIWQYLYRGAYWRRGPVTMTAISAVDVALWDIKGKRAGMPLYELLGGRSRKGALAYGHASGSDLPELFASVRGHLDRGFRAIRIQSGVPTLGQVYGLGPADQDDGDHYEPAIRGALPAEEIWDTSAYLHHIPQVFEAVRSEFGDRLPLLHDAHHRLTANEAAILARSLEPFRLFWLEDATPAENQAMFRRIRSQSVTPLAVGEVLDSVWDYQTLITEQLIDFVRSSVTHAGGITSVKKLTDFAGLYQVRSGFHGPTDISPVGQAAAIHLDLAIHNFGIQEYMPHSSETLAVFDSDYVFADGFLNAGDRPGLGVIYRDDLAATHPYTPAYLPVNRLRDGTVHDW
jgi:mannonate dehydratase